MNLTVVVTVFPLIFLAELPDKTMFASLLLASRGRPLAVWIGACLAFGVHVVIAVSAGVALFRLLPHRAVDAIVAAMFIGGAIYAYLSRGEEEAVEETESRSAWSVGVAAAGIIFVAEWGDLTQILTANLAAAYHDGLSVGVGAITSLMAVAGVAVLSGSRLVAVVPIRTLRLITSIVLVALGVYTAVRAL